MKATRREFLKLGMLSAAGLFTRDITPFMDKDKIKHFSGRPEPDKWVYSACGYCAVGCGMYIGVSNGRIVTVKADPEHPTNKGRLCQKGIWEHLAVHHPDRLTKPLLRKTNGRFSKSGKLRPVSWDEALGVMKEQFSQFQPTRIGVLSTGQLLTEEVYALSKLVRIGLRTPHFDGNTTLCMASTVAGYTKSFGGDGPPGCYDDFNYADLVLVFGSNMSECHPIIFYRMDQGKKERKFLLIVVDPRKTQLARHADMHLAINPGADNVLLYGIAHILIKEEKIDKHFIDNHTDGFDEFRASVEKFTPQMVSEATGLPVGLIKRVAEEFVSAYNVVTCWAPAINQSIHGVSNVTAINNLHLLTGKIGRPGCAPFSFTGQCNAMGGREFDGKGKTLPGYRLLTNPVHRKEISRFWSIDEAVLPERPGYSHTEIINAAFEDKIDGIWVICTNPVISVPDRNHCIAAFKRVKFLVVQDIFPTSTTQLADLVLPAAMWSEKTGVMTNSERRVNLAQKAVDPPGEARSDFEIFLSVAHKFGYNNIFKGWRTTADAFEEIKKISSGRPCDYTGITYKKIQEFHGIQWPVRDAASSGTPRLYGDFQFNTEGGMAHLVAAMAIPQVPESTDEEYPFVLNTGRVLEHWHTSTKTARIIPLERLVPESFVEIHPEDAQSLGIKDKDTLRLQSRRGEIVLKARVTSIISKGSLFVPFFDADITVNSLTINSIDVISKQPNYKQCAVRISRV